MKQQICFIQLAAELAVRRGVDMKFDVERNIEIDDMGFQTRASSPGMSLLK